MKIHHLLPVLCAAACILIIGTSAHAQETPAAPAPAAVQPPEVPQAPQAAPAPAAAIPAFQPDGGSFSWDSVGEAAFFVGVAAMLGGGVCVGMTKKTDADLQNATDDAARQNAKDSNAMYQKLAIGLFIAGGILVSAGATVWALAGDDEMKKKFSLAPVFDGRTSGIVMQGSW